MKADVMSLCREIMEQESHLPKKSIGGLFGKKKERQRLLSYTDTSKKSLRAAKKLEPYVKFKNIKDGRLKKSDYLNKIICGDSLEIMKAIPDGVFDLVVTSPPYNLKNSTGNGMKDGRGGKWANAQLMKGYADHGDELPHGDYVAWQRQCLQHMMRLIHKGGAIFYNHKWRVQGGLLQDRQDIVSGFPVRQVIIWRRKGGINFNPGYFLPTYEVIYLIAKPGFRLAPKANALGDVWESTQEMSNPHPAPFPVDLIERIIGSTSAKLVLDPFMGSGTTAVAAKNLDRGFTGIELSENYCEMAIRRLRGEDWQAEEEPTA
jgi:site-specific DNA-methyltransferase (adenine-specific)